MAQPTAKARSVGPADVQAELDRLKETMSRLGGGNGVPPELLQSAQELLAREGMQGLQAAADQAQADASEASRPKCLKGHHLQKQAPGVTEWVNGKSTTGYLPKEVRGDAVLMKLDGDKWRLTNEHLKSPNSYIAYRRSKDLEDRVKEGVKIAEYGAILDGFDEGDGWVRVCMKAKEESPSRIPLGCKCDRCGGSAYDFGDMWSCRACDYDECGVCAARIKCPEGHGLEKKNSGFSDWLTGMTCDVCKQNPWKSGSVWSCRVCDFDQCGKCMGDKSLSKVSESSSPGEVAARADAPVKSEKPVTQCEKPATSVPLPSEQPSAPAMGSTAQVTAEPVHEDPGQAKDKAATLSTVPDSEAVAMKKARDAALARKRAIEERMAADAAALLDEEQQLNDIRKKLGNADKVMQRSESLRGAIEQDKRDIQRLDREKVQQSEFVRKARDAVNQALAAEAACEATLQAKQAHCQMLEQEMVDFLLEAEKPQDDDKAKENGELTADVGLVAISPADSAVTAPPPPPPPPQSPQSVADI